MKVRFAFCFLALMGLLNVVAGEVTLRPFNDGWEFRWQDESAWRPAPVPHDAMRDRPFAVDEAHPVRADEALFNQGYRKGGVVTYRKRFRRPVDGARLAVRFDGVFADSEVSLNGHPVAARHNGYVPFEAKLDDLQEDNLLEVRCRAEVPGARWYTGAGLLRDVWLVRRTGWAPEPDAVAVSTAVRDGTAQVEVRIDGAEVVSPYGGRYEIKNAELWCPESPRLYEVEVVARNGKGETGACKIRFGVKTVEFTRDRGLILNGKPYRLKGVCLHENFGCLGGALNRSALRRQLQEIKSMGANAIRTAHNPFAPAFYDFCDEMGFLVMDEIFDEWEAGKTKYGYHRFFQDDALKDLETVVRRDRNHPCLLLWSIGNEIGEMSKPGEDGRRAKDWTTRLATAVRRLDPAHPVTAGCLKTPKVEENGILSELDVVGLNYNRAAYDELKGRYCILGSETTAVPVSRDAYLFREGADGAMEIVDRANGWTHSAYGASLFKWAPDGLEGSLAIQDRCPWSAGEFVWSAYDYTGEPDTPKPETKNFFWPAVSSPWGIHDLAGFRKDRFYLLKSAWTDEPTAHLLPDWTHPGNTGRRFPVWCYTNAEEGELFLNGKSQGVRRFSETSARHLEWKVAYEPGVLEFAGRMKDGRTVRAKRKTAGPVVRYAVSTDYEDTDYAFFRINAVDAAGTRVIACDDVVCVRGIGGEVVATDGGDPADHAPFASRTRRLHRGSILAAVKKDGGTAGVEVERGSSDANQSGLTEAEAGFVPLFNGKDLSGWEGATNTYCVSSEGYLTCVQKDGMGESGTKNLWTVRDYTNFVIRFDVKLPPNANNGLGIRTRPNGWCSREGMELQLLDDWGDAYRKLSAAHFTGAVYGVVPPLRKANGESYLNKPNEWNSVEVKADGPQITFILNGAKIVDTDVSKFSTDGTVPPDGIKRPGLHNKAGRIHWCGHGHNIYWRNIRIKELP